MANVVSAASLVLKGKVPDLGWRRGAIAFAKNGVPKPNTLIINGREMMAENCSFLIRTYANRKAVYVPVGSNYKDAFAILERRQVTRQRENLDKRLGIIIPKTAEEIAAEKAEEKAARQAARKTLNQWVTEYIAKKKTLSIDSVALYRDTIQPFAEFSGKKFLEDITGQDVADWCHSLSQAGYAQRTIQTRYCAVRGFLRVCGVNLTTLIDSATHRRLARKPEAETEPYSEEQIARLMAVYDERHKVIFSLLLTTGMRYREANHLTWRQINWKENKIRVEGQMTIHAKRKVVKFSTKNLKSRDIPLFAGLKAILLEWREKNPDTLFVVGSKGARNRSNGDLPDNHWLPKLKEFARKAGLNCGVCENCAAKDECEEFYLHKFRHTYAHVCLEKFSIHQVSKWMGHNNITTTSIYLSGTPKEANLDPFALAA